MRFCGRRGRGLLPILLPHPPVTTAQRATGNSDASQRPADPRTQARQRSRCQRWRRADTPSHGGTTGSNPACATTRFQGHRRPAPAPAPASAIIRNPNPCARTGVSRELPVHGMKIAGVRLLRLRTRRRVRVRVTVAHVIASAHTYESRQPERVPSLLPGGSACRASHATETTEPTDRPGIVS